MKNYEIEVCSHLSIDAEEPGEAMAKANILLLKLNSNLVDSTITKVKEANS